MNKIDLGDVKPYELADKSCKKCHGKGIVNNNDDLSKYCDCVVLQFCKNYLTPTYVGEGKGMRIQNFDYKPLEGKNLIFDEMELIDFESIVKSFLLGTGARIKHFTTTGYEIAQLSFNHEQFSLTHYNVELLIIVLSYDPDNKRYKEIIPHLLCKRKLNGLVTWIYYKNEFTKDKSKVNSPEFEKKYGKEVIQTLVNLKFIGYGKLKS